MSDEAFQSCLEDFHELFDSKVELMEKVTSKVVEICHTSLATGNIRHTPITSRIKKWRSAKGSVSRRNDERVARGELRAAVEAKGTTTWAEYCHMWGQETSEDETKPFSAPEEMLAALHDFGGVRISLYFPGDVDRVAKILRERFDVQRVTRKDPSAGNVRRLQERVENLERDEPGDPGDGRFERIFGGYKATHFAIKLREENMPVERRRRWKEVVVEIQVGTLVMHVWSEIEHDMIYKPLADQGQKISEDEERVLDLINGIVMTGEAALRQLEASTTKRMDSRAQDKAALASSYYELGIWIEKYYVEKGKPLEDGDWQNLDQLFALLKVSGDHQHDKLYVLLASVAETFQWVAPNRIELPRLILEVMCTRAPRKEDPELQGIKVTSKVFHLARFWALHLVHSLNMAIYLGVGSEFVNLSSARYPPPSLVAILDILHPGSPQYQASAGYPPSAGYSPNSSAEGIMDFCVDVINTHARSPNRSLRVAANLPKTSRILGTAEFDEPRTVLVPGIIGRLFMVSAGPMMGDFDAIMAPDESEPYRILDFIDFYLERKAADDDKLVIWDRLTAQSGDRRRGPIDQRTYVSKMRSTGSTNDALWKLVDSPIQQEVISVDMYETGQPSEFTALMDRGPADGALDLAYRLYPRHQWPSVQKAWRLATRLRPAEILMESVAQESGRKVRSQSSRQQYPGTHRQYIEFSSLPAPVRPASYKGNSAPLQLPQPPMGQYGLSGGNTTGQLSYQQPIMPSTLYAPGLQEAFSFSYPPPPQPLQPPEVPNPMSRYYTHTPLARPSTPYDPAPSPQRLQSRALGPPKVLSFAEVAAMRRPDASKKE